MINYLFASFIIVGIIYSFIVGNTNIVGSSLLSSGKTAIDMVMGMVPLLCLWLGVMRIAEDSGLLKKISFLFSKVIHPLFPELNIDSSANSYIASNMIMNMFGLGNAATPFGLKAMEMLKKEQGDTDIASRSMITFLVINTASVTLIPTTVISMRILNHSNNPTEILLSAIIVTILSFFVGIFLDKLFFYIWKKKGIHE